MFLINFKHNMEGYHSLRFKMQNIENDLHKYRFVRMKNITIVAEISGVVSCLIAIAVIDIFRIIPSWYYVYPAIAAYGTFVSYKSKTLQLVWLSGTIMLFACAICIGMLANAWGNATFWFLPLGLIATIPVGPASAKLSHFVITSIVVWLSLYLSLQPNLIGSGNLVPTILIIMTGFVAATATCMELIRDRTEIFDLQRKLHSLAYTDPLTGVPNRRSFLESLTSEMLNINAKTHLYFYMIDIDNFKSINDTFGHDTGDQILIRVAGIIRSCSGTHIFGRIGGEEFAIAAILPDPESAESFGSFLVESVGSNKTGDVETTISTGAAEHRLGETVSNLMRRSDLALYLAKQSGKNRCAMAA